MDHSELVSRVASELSKPKTVVGAVLASAAKHIIQGIDSGDGRVTVKDLGVFKRTERSARRGRNIRTGVEMDIPARNILTFKPAKAVRDLIAG